VSVVLKEILTKKYVNMKKLLFLLFISVLCINSAYAQETEQKLVINKGYKITSNGVKLTNDEVLNILSVYPDLQKTFNSGAKNLKGAAALGWIGGFAFGFGIGGILGSVVMGNEIKSYNYYIMGAGAVLLVPGIALEVVGKKKIKNSINQFNNMQNQSSNIVKMNFGLTPNGAGIVIDF